MKFGTLILPFLFVSHLKNKPEHIENIGRDESDMLKHSIRLSADAETELNHELQLSLELSHAFGRLLRAVNSSRDYGGDVAFAKAAAACSAAVHAMQKQSNIAFECLHPTILPIRAHYDVDASSHTDDDVVVEFNRVLTRFSPTSDGELVVVSLRPLPDDPKLMHMIHEEIADALKNPVGEDTLVNLSRGVVWSDAEMGIACLATSKLAGLGAAVDADGQHLVFLDQDAETAARFFETVFVGSQLRNSWEAVVPNPCVERELDWSW